MLDLYKHHSFKSGGIFYLRNIFLLKSHNRINTYLFRQQIVVCCFASSFINKNVLIKFVPINNLVCPEYFPAILKQPCLFHSFKTRVRYISMLYRLEGRFGEKS